jgi:hypothetical protein
MKTVDILPKKMLESLYLIQKLSDDQIAKQYHLTLGQIHRLRRKYNIRTIEQYERHPKEVLSETETSVIIGTMLGDGHMRKRSGKKTYPQLMLEQSIKHKEYVYWLKEQLKDWLYNLEKPIITNRKLRKQTGKWYHSLSFQTVCHPVFNEIYKGFYKRGKKVLGKGLVERYFTLLSFAVWVQDDGFLSGNCKRIGISTNNFTLNEVKFLRQFLQKRFQLKGWVCKRTTKDTISWELHFDKPSTRKISEMLQELVVESMQYKILSSETTKGTEQKLRVPKV